MLFRGFWENLKKPIIGLAPMDGVTDASFRYMVCKYGKPSVVITEFTNVEGLARGNARGLISFLYSEIERPVVAQIFGVEPESFYKSAVMLCALGFDGIDINMGCPVNKVAAKGSGAALIKTPELAKKIIRMTKKGVKDWVEGISLEKAGVLPEMIVEMERMNEDRSLQMQNVSLPSRQAGPVKHSNKKISRKLIPVSVKTRIGYDEIVAEEWVKHLLKAEPANISMHGRTLKQLYRGEANWEVLARAAKVVHESGSGISFLGNGDVKSIEDARKKITEYGVDGVLAGRAVLGNPWFFAGREPGLEERFIVTIEHAKYFSELNHLSFFNIRKHLGWYCKSFEGAKDLRVKLMGAKNFEDVEREIETVLEKLS